MYTLKWVESRDHMLTFKLLLESEGWMSVMSAGGPAVGLLDHKIIHKGRSLCTKQASFVPAWTVGERAAP